ncbi:MAG: dicarboxylate/amino acid:cation symporter [Candidatus Zixiibacteriota bacterium]|nr:MAG: dicarboxylate/amino acid:cation symporter [candidate division Zixibacteria bacterium]
MALLDFLKRINITGWIFVGIICGVLTGWLVGEPALVIAGPLGDMFIRLLRMIIIPLITASLISGISSIGSGEGLGRLGAKTFIYYMSTSLMAITVGMVIMNMVAPGYGIHLDLGEAPETFKETTSVWQSVYSLIQSMVPTNLVKAIADGDILPLIFFCILFGIFITRLPEKGRVLFTDIFSNFFEIMMKITHLVIMVAPFGIFGLITKVVATTGFDALVPLLKYFFCILGGLMFHAFITLPLLLRLVGRVSPVRHVKAMIPALLTAFSTASSGATLPLTMECVEKRAGVSNKVTSFVLPMGATINMDGTALYEAAAVLFIAQTYGIHLGIVQQLIVVITALAASVATAAIPKASLATIPMIMAAIGVPFEGIAIIQVFDRILDMCRTTVNVFSDSCGAVVIARTEGETPLAD